METATLSVSPEALRQGALKLKSELSDARSLTVDSPGMFQAVGAVLIQQLKVLDEMQAQRDGVTNPLYAGWKKACELFKEGLQLQSEICATLKGKIAEYELALANAKALATAQARAALQTGDVPTIERALTVVNQAGSVAAKGVSTAIAWAVKRLVEPAPCAHCGSTRGMVPRQYWTEGADLGALNEMAGRWREEEPPIVPGVVFERAASVTGRRK